MLSPFGESMEKEMTEKQSPTSMHDLLTKRERMRNKWRELIRLGMSTTRQPRSEPSGKFEHFATEEERQLHLQQVSEAQKNGAPF